MFGKKASTYRHWVEEWKRYRSIPDKIDVVNLGSTMTARDFDYSLWEKCGKIGFNMASSPQTLYYDKQVLEQYGSHLNHKAIVIISLAEFSLLVDKYNNDTYNYKYYGYLDSDRILNYSMKKSWIIRKMPALIDTRLIKQELTYYAKLFLRKKTKTRSCDIYVDSSQVMAGWRREFGWDKTYSLRAEQYKTINHTWETVQEIIAYCIQHGFEPIVIIPPVARYLKEIMPDNILGECLWKYVDILKDRGIRVIDFMDDISFLGHELYENAICLNEEGRKLFNNRILNVVFGEKLEGNAETGNEMLVGVKAGENKNFGEKSRYKSRLGKKSRSYKLRNGLEIPWISYGTGVVWKYTRNPVLFLKVNARQIISSAFRKKLNRELRGNLFIKKSLMDAYTVGFRMFDTGRIYAKSEKYIGDTVSNNVFVTSKCSAMDVERKCSPNSVDGNLEVSLRNLKRDQIDLYLLHWPEGEHWLDYYGQIVKAYKEGKIRAFGACNLKMEHIIAIENAGLELPMVIQEECHPFYSRADIREYCREKGIQFEAHTATMRSSPIALENDVLLSIARKYNKTVPQVIIRWHYQNDVIPVCSSFNKKHMEEDLDIFDFEITDEEMNAIDSLNMDYICLDADGIDDPNYVFNE